MTSEALTIGLEEEFFVIDPRTWDLATSALDVDRLNEQFGDVAGTPRFDHEYQLSIVESRTAICADLSQVRAELLALRRTLVMGAADMGLVVVSSGTLPLTDWRAARITPKPRYQQITPHYGEVVERRLTCGCHVHIGIADRELAVQVLNRVRPWLPVLLALSASSPFFERFDTKFASYRTVLWDGFPVAALPFRHASYDDYAATIQLLVDTGTMLDSSSVYWDARLGLRFPTLELRVADGCSTVDEAVLQAGLSRALVATCRKEVEAGAPEPYIRPELLHAARWRAAKSGLDDRLIDAAAGDYSPAFRVVDRLLAYLHDALVELGDWDEVSSLVEDLRRRGTSARRQRAVAARTGDLRAVGEALAAETASDSWHVQGDGGRRT